MGSYARDTRLEEKQDLIHLNNKLADYMRRVRSLGASGQNSQLFLDTLRSIEDEVQKLKNLYECELDKLRRKLEEANRIKNDAISDVEKNRRVAADFEDRFRAEKDKIGVLTSELACLQRKVGELEKELTAARSSAASPKAQLAAVESDLARECAKNKDLARKLDEELAKNKQLTDQNKVLQQKQGFSDKVQNEQLRDAHNKLEQAKCLITDLEKKNKDLERQLTSLPEMLDQMRKKTEKDLLDYRKELEAANAKNNAAMRKQLEEQERQLLQLRADNSKLEAENGRLMGRFRELEGQIRDLESQKASLEQQLANERNRSSERMRELERKLKELQDQLFRNLQDVTSGKEAQVTLKQEIETYRILLEEEDRRLRNDAGSRPCSRTGPARSPPPSPIKCAKPATPTKARGPGLYKPGNDPRTEYQFAYSKPNWARAKTSADGLPKFQSGNSKLYMSGDGHLISTGHGHVRQSLPRVY
ncbi:prelamin-A/C-like [Dreissena polymorpha]|uniref:prelamin-A/C-like n=1 Tax=Dreissena polymorpha TaxID=45954 RepID=UPI0022648F60|nr:prelamin-A/C-like [Dreissena polymorpha]